MGKYYTPPRPALGFANSGSAYMHRLNMTVEPIIHTTCDHHNSRDDFSGVVSRNVDEWEQSTSQILFPPSISDIVPDSVNPAAPTIVYLTGSNFVPDSTIYLNDIKVDATATNYINQYIYSFQPPPWPQEQGVTVKIVRPDGRSGSLTDYFFYEFTPVLNSVETDLLTSKIYHDGGSAMHLEGSHLKPGSVVFFTSVADPTKVSSGTVSWNSDTSVYLYSPQMPLSGAWDVPMVGAFGVKIVSPSGLSSTASLSVTSIYQRPRIDAVVPDQGNILTDIPNVEIRGDYFLPGATPYLSTSVGGLGLTYSLVKLNSLTPDKYDPYKIIVNLPQWYSTGTIGLYVVNAEDSQTSNTASFQYVLPYPVVLSATFDDRFVEVWSTGSVGGKLWLSGTNFSGSDANQTITSAYFRATGALTKTLDVSPQSVTARTMYVTIPSETSNGLKENVHYDIVVSSSAGTGSFTSALLYKSVPNVLSVNPSYGPYDQETSVELLGGTFNYSTASFGAYTGSISIAESNRLVVSAPTGSATWSFVDITVKNVVPGAAPPYPTSVKPNAFLYYSAPRITSLIPSSGSMSGCKVLASMSNYLGTGPTPGTKLWMSGSGSELLNPISVSTWTAPTVQYGPGVYQLSMPSRGISGTFKITASNYINTADAAVTSSYINFEFVPDPTILYLSSAYGTSSSPVFALGAGGETIAITGSNFAAGSTWVVVGGVTASSTTWIHSGSCSFIAPAFVAGGLKDVQVWSRGVVSASWPQAIKYMATPVYSSVNPSTVDNKGGSTVIINGEYFTSESRVFLSGTPVGSPYLFAGDVNVVEATINATTTPTQISISTPAASASAYGDVKITIQNKSANGTLINSVTSPSNALRYEVTPYVSGVVGSKLNTVEITGTAPTITVVGTYYVSGSGFTPTSVVYINDTTTVVTSVYVNSNRINITPPVNTIGMYNFYVSNGALASNKLPVLYRSVSGPAIQAIVPNGGVITQAQTEIYISTLNTSGSEKLFYNGVEVVTSSHTYGATGQITATLAQVSSYGPAVLSLSNSFGSSSYAMERVVTPYIASVNPTASKVIGGTFNINGSSFLYNVDDTAIYVAGTKITSSFGISPTIISNVKLPDSLTSQGHVTASIQVVHKNTGSFTINQLVLVPVPTITAVNSVSGVLNTALGGKVQVTGTNFLGDGFTTLIVGGTPATITSQTSDRLFATLQPHAAGYVTARVNNRDDAAFAEQNNAIEYVVIPAPSITSISTGTISAVGALVSMSLTNTQSGTQYGGVAVTESVYLDYDVPANRVLVPFTQTGNVITASIPAHAPGVSKINVVNAFGVSNSQSIEFVAVPTITYPTNANSASISTQLGGVLAVTGTNFSTTGLIAKVGGVSYPVSSATTTGFNVTIPPALSTGLKDLYVDCRGVTNTIALNAIRISTFASPAITSLSPSSIPLNLSSSVRVNATNLVGNESVKLNGSTSNVSITARASGYIDANFYISASGSYTVSLSNSYGDAGSTATLSSAPPATLTSLSPSTVYAYVTNAMRIYASNLVGSEVPRIDGSVTGISKVGSGSNYVDVNVSGSVGTHAITLSSSYGISNALTMTVANDPPYVEYLIVGGGGSTGGGVSGETIHGGGGAGAVLSNTAYPVTPGQSYAIKVGAGGAASNNNGENSFFGSITASAGTSGYYYAHGGDSGNGYSGGAWVFNKFGVAGGGAGAGGSGYSPTDTIGQGGPGVTGITLTPGVTTTYAEGGSSYPTGGGGTAGGANTGTGGSGENAAGGSGVVIIRYPSSYVAATVTGVCTSGTASGYRTYKFTSGNATITF